MASNLRFKTNYAVSRKIEPFYKGGKIQISKDGTNMFCTCGPKLNVLDISTGAVVHSIEQDDQEDISSFALSPDDESYSKDLPGAVLPFHRATSRIYLVLYFLFTGGCDSTIKIWDVIKQYCTHNLKGSSGVVHVAEFHPDISQLQLFSSSTDYKIRIWNLKSSKCIAVLENHYSAVTSLSFSADGSTLVSSGRDKICTVWDLKSRTIKRTIPVYESVEGALVLPGSGDSTNAGSGRKGLHFITAGSKENSTSSDNMENSMKIQGVLRIWEADTARCVYTQTVSHPPQEGEGEAGTHSLTFCTLVPTKHQIATVNVEHNIILYNLQTLQLRKQFAGYNDEILDVKFLGPSDSHIVVATNSPQLKVFELSTSNCQILYGHTDTVLALDVFKKGLMFSSCGKDKSVRVWQMDKATSEVRCVAQGFGHTHGVGAMSCSRMKESFVVTGSQDCTLKIWKLTESLTSKSKEIHLSEPETLQASVTEKCHDKKFKQAVTMLKTVGKYKDINSIAVSPNDKLIATGSQDKSAKLWACADCALQGVFRGHKRGIWCVQFSPVDQVLATSSADGTLKLWGLHDFSCLKTFEGHDASVLKAVFISRGTQMLTSGSDGLLKLWTIKTNECVKTLDGHEDKVWGLHCNKADDTLVTGSTDSCIILWKDVTESELAEEQEKQEEQIVRQQELSNLLHEKQFSKALGLAISLDHPHTVLTVVKAIIREPGGKEKLERVILKLRHDQRESVLKYCTTWNTNSRNCLEAQAVVKVLLTHETPDTLLQYNGIKTAIESLLPYTDRHLQRLNRLLQASMFVDFMWQNMRLAELPAQADKVQSSLPPPLQTVNNME